jgi:hypothetical protein
MKSRKGKGVIMILVHIFSRLIHTVQELKRRGEQGFSSLYTQKLPGYYDYLYIYKSRCETNLSLNWGKA